MTVQVVVDRADLVTVLDQRVQHDHSTPGVWDADGRPCVECAARARLAAALGGGGQPPEAGDARARIGQALAEMHASGAVETYHAKSGLDESQANDGMRLVEALQAAGFTVVGQRAGMYVRLAWPDSHPRANTLRVPVGDVFADYADALADVVAELEYAARRGEAARKALDLHRMETQP